MSPLRKETVAGETGCRGGKKEGREARVDRFICASRIAGAARMNSKSVPLPSHKPQGVCYR